MSPLTNSQNQTTRASAASPPLHVQNVLIVVISREGLYGTSHHHHMHHHHQAGAVAAMRSMGSYPLVVNISITTNNTIMELELSEVWSVCVEVVSVSDLHAHNHVTHTHTHEHIYTCMMDGCSTVRAIICISCVC